MENVPTLGYVTREDAKRFAPIPGIAAFVRNEHGYLTWANPTCARIFPVPFEELVGTDLEAILPPSAAEERRVIMQRIIETGEPFIGYQFTHDMRLLTHATPIDPESFGYTGVFLVMHQASVLDESHDLPVLRTPVLAALGALSRRELELVHELALGHRTADIAQNVHRSPRTIDNQIRSMELKLEMPTRAHLVRYLVESGVHQFTKAQWEQIVEDSHAMRRELQAMR